MAEWERRLERREREMDKREKMVAEKEAELGRRERAVKEKEESAIGKGVNYTQDKIFLYMCIHPY